HRSRLDRKLPRLGLGWRYSKDREWRYGSGTCVRRLVEYGLLTPRKASEVGFNASEWFDGRIALDRALRNLAAGLRSGDAKLIDRSASEVGAWCWETGEHARHLRRLMIVLGLALTRRTSVMRGLFGSRQEKRMVIESCKAPKPPGLVSTSVKVRQRKP